MKSLCLALPLVVLGLLGTTAQAQSYRFGVAAGAAAPMADLKEFNDQAIPMIGGFVDVDFGKGHVLRPRIDFMGSMEKKESLAYYTGTKYGYDEFKRTIPGISLGVDYAYYLAGKQEGLYLTAGVGVYSFSAKTVWGGYEDKQSSTKVGASIGAGWDYNANWGGQVKYFGTKFKTNAPYRSFSNEPSLSGVAFTLTYKF